MNDPAFLFYPGDYLRDTQILSPPAQAAYDRIMCEHMRNICITPAQLKLITKDLDKDQKAELTMVLHKTQGGYQIPWVAQSIEKRRAYSESRRKNRLKTKKKTSKTYVQHMENEIEDENVIESKNETENETQSKTAQKTKTTTPATIWQLPQLKQQLPHFVDTELQQLWQEYLHMRWQAHKFRYKSLSTQRIAFEELARTAHGETHQAKLLLRQTIAHQWKGFFERKETSENGLEQIQNATRGQKSAYLQ